LFWKNLSPTNAGGGKLENGALKSALERDFGSVEEFKKRFNASTAAIEGSGWGWLVRTFYPLHSSLFHLLYLFIPGLNKFTKKLEIVTTSNQDPLLL
jgi:Fe-Mn family superoxide dismutase